MTRRLRACQVQVTAGVLFLLNSLAFAHEDPDDGLVATQEIVVRDRRDLLLGTATTASTGLVTQAQIRRLPTSRTAEVLERIPGMIATQHSGTGKANQYFLRGFNLDHGTDFSTSIEGVPMNLPSHGHGQGYLDLNPLIPELIDVIEFRKGPYYADVGDFSSAGTAAIEYVRHLHRPFIDVTVGSFGFYRVVPAASVDAAGGDLLIAGDIQFYDGPWDRSEDLRKLNGFAKWTWGDHDDGFSLHAAAYGARWDSTDQIAARAVSEGLVGRRGFLDDDTGGNSHRYTLAAHYWRGEESPFHARVWGVLYDLDLWSNFTYFLDDPINGDEFQQIDRRARIGADLSQEFGHEILGYRIVHTVGTQLRHDAIGDVGLQRTADRQPIRTVRRDRATVTSVGFYWQAEAELTSWMRTYTGVRGDLSWFDVNAYSEPVNSGDRADGIASPKVGLVFGPWADTELYLNYGRGFHSNDARGTTIRVDPVSSDPAERVDPLVATQGAETGVRSTWVPGLHSTAAFWWLDLDSELLFVGDAGNTEATRPSRRYGVEFSNQYRPLEWLILDAEVTFTHAEFRDRDPAGDSIPGAIETTVAAGATVEFDNGLFGSMRLRHFGERPLIEDDSVRSNPTTLVNLQAGWESPEFSWGRVSLTLDVLNLFDSDDDDITYYYASRLPGEPVGGIEDRHFHSVEPLQVRGSATWKF